MDFTYSEEQEMLREGARRFLADKSPLDRVREIVETTDGYDAELWGAIGEQGWTAMHIPEHYGGAGFSYAETAILLHEMGRVLAPVPFLSSLLAAEAILAGGDDAQKAEWLPKLASGEIIGTVAVAEPAGDWDEASVAVAASRDGDGFSLTGTKSFVTAGHVADLLVVAARLEGEVALFLVGGDAVSATKLVTLDTTRSQATVELAGAAAVRLGAAGWDVVERVYRVAGTALSSEQVGGLERTLEMAVEYAKDRKQFGRAIGSFQAIKHLCADMLVSLESARSASGYAVWALATGSEELAVAAPLAKAYCSEAYFKSAGDNIQIHGGIGFTWEHDAHLYFKRAKSTELLFGSPQRQRRELADRVGI
ncbi:MAG: acyl-CoA/acyl-ACP dehydrogenase [Acidimicrobiia bacterium]|nr:acyl-CoA/acyl-ACP dehydrogenase [Acidimicrobiia bacterium]NNL12393.1 acyl-CoA/acyl-ACP dehydrogenase [Acidimicrobiia bacterium]RZV47259.1 MAG: acyl-CoA dehydrogenase [Acidimicrobiia bacterium]